MRIGDFLAMERLTEPQPGQRICLCDSAGTAGGKAPRDKAGAKGMIDNFALAVSHGLMLLAVWILLRRPDLDREPSPKDHTPQAGDTPGA
jgi:hypothetical protein